MIRTGIVAVLDGPGPPPGAKRPAGGAVAQLLLGST
jgi:hypothetical protein